MGNKTDHKFLHRLATDSVSNSEHEAFYSWLTTLSSNQYQRILEEYEKVLGEVSFEEEVDPLLLQRIKHKIEDHERILKSKEKKVFSWVSIAASILIISSVALFLKNDAVEDLASLSFEQRLSNDISPGKNQAYLELADGSVIALDEFAPDKIWEESGVMVKKTEEGQLLYDFEGKSNALSKAPTYHTISTPKGGEYQLILPDGTKVWLNASSRLKFPTIFNGDDRSVELSGEAYFDVVSNRQKPFIITTGKESIKVLGTEFNISSYADEEISKTTLLEGKVEVTPLLNKSALKILKPGEQSLIKGNSIQVMKADLDEAVAWKNGEFMFNRESIESVMRKVARWYDVEVVYNQPIGNEVKIWGSVSRFENISEMLKFIERTKVAYFKVEGRKVYVSK